MKKKILLLSDDLRMHSGIATVSRDIVLNTVDKFDWIQVGAAIEHPDQGKFIDVSDDVKKLTGVEDASVKILPFNGYGNPMLIRYLIEQESPDAILHFTDPRFWEWLYEMENEIRKKIPLIYLNIWDSMPDPYYNREAYSSCDLLMAISKQTYGINNRVLTRYEGNVSKNRIAYIPHGISHTDFFPITKEDSKFNDLLNFKNQVLGNKDFEFITFWNNRNIRRKNPGDLILAFKHFINQLPEDKRDKCLLLLHTQPIDQHGTNIPDVIKELAPEIKVAFSDKHISREFLNYLYNIADVTINISSNEGFGLATAESLMAGTPVIVNVTGGLQDQCGFKLNAKYLTEHDYVNIGSLHDKLLWKDNPDLSHGAWAYPVWASNRSLQGSVPTPYIFDDRVDFREAGDALLKAYENRHMKNTLGNEAREFMLSSESGLSAKEMGIRIKNAITNCIDEFMPQPNFKFIKI